ncbi:MAG: hypothetical protein M0Z69_03635 [Actinomycetota bacterium]|nr:hypothetical protein [Actinomycetota bacterium]
MASVAKGEWDTTAKERLDELEAIHTRAHGAKRGRRWGTEQLNRSLFVVLLAQFQTYCRDLHDEAVDVYVAAGNPHQQATLRKFVTQNRDLDKKNARPAALGSDFGRFGIELVPKLKALGQATADALNGLDLLVDFRNAVAHGNESSVAATVATGQIKATLASYRAHRRTLDQVVGTMDQVVASELANELRIPRPW